MRSAATFTTSKGNNNNNTPRTMMVFILTPLRQIMCSLGLLFRQMILLLCLIEIAWLPLIYGTSYFNVTRLLDDKLRTGQLYNTAIRPIFNQNDVVTVKVEFDIIAIVEIKDNSQRFVINGFTCLQWTDQLLAWNPSEYGGLKTFSPYAKHLWRPRVIVGNTLEERDVFKDNYHPIYVHYNGSVTWLPGSLFITSCGLDLRKYPFDSQRCFIELLSLDHSGKTVRFVTTRKVVGQRLYSKNGEWDIRGTRLITGNKSGIPYFKAEFHLKRRPGFFVLNIVMPIFLLSFLNLMVFLIPVDSGEKISYGITVLLALTLFMTIISEGLPSTSDTIPLIVYYLVVVLFNAGATVIATIAVVTLHHLNVRETKRFKEAQRRITRAVGHSKAQKQLPSKPEQQVIAAARYAAASVAAAAAAATVPAAAAVQGEEGEVVANQPAKEEVAGSVEDESRRSVFFPAVKPPPKQNYSLVDASTSPRESDVDPLDCMARGSTGSKNSRLLWSNMSGFWNRRSQKPKEDNGEKWKKICRYIDMAFFAIFTTVWVIVSSTFLVTVMF